ncbi:MAG TPA: hypothetical protein VF092_28835 [Longimicrobium sp.]
MDSLTPPRESPPGPLLIAGGEIDYSLHSLRRQALTRGFEHIVLFSGASGQPTLSWDMERDRLELDGREIRPGACFIRNDVFSYMADKREETARRAQAWYAAIAGWLMVHPEVRILNRRFGSNNNKPYQLHLARLAGLDVPTTRITNDLDAVERWAGERLLVAKPVQGGSHCREIEEMVEVARDEPAGPFIVQNRLVQPEIRLYRIGGRFVAFEMRSEVLDYRTTAATQVIPRPLSEVPRELCDGLARVMDALAMDFGAADFKTDPETGRFVFLEINSSPMFYGFDLSSRGAVSDAILDALTGGPAPREPAREPAAYAAADELAVAPV